MTVMKLCIGLGRCRVAIPSALDACVSADSVAGTQEYQHGGRYRSAEISCATGRLLQLAGPSRNCPTCRRFVYSTDPESYPRNYALEAALDSLPDRFFADTAGSELDASTLRITEEILGEGGTGMVKAGELRLGQINVKVSLLCCTTAAQ